ncbi:MAG: type II secretion system F family protein [Eggerthellaceae bacterium]|nr:type II secretion system F family protein [Eggerthellaceae bacterium]
MQQFKYKAINLQREIFEGTFIAKDENDLGVELSKQGLYLISAVPYSGKTPSSFFTLGTGKVGLTELTTFCRQFSIMVNAGISLIGCIEILKEQSFSSFFRQVLGVIYEDVKAGMMLSDAVEKHNKVFPAFFRNMLKVGENSGKMDMVMNSLADYYERDDAIVRKARGAFAYPAMLLLMTFAIVLLMLVFVIPTFEESISQLQRATEFELEDYTIALFSMADWMTANWLYVLAGLVIVVFLFWAFGRTKQGAYIYDWLKLRLPFVKNIQIDLISARFARGFGLLLSSGMDVTEALDAVQIVLINRDVERRFKAAVDDIVHGLNMSTAFDKYKLFPPILIQMIAVGERTASVDEVLMRSCTFFDAQVERSISSVTNKIQPAMLILMGAVAGGMFLSVYSPIISIMNILTSV